MTFNPLDPELLAQETHVAVAFGVFLALFYRVLPVYGVADFGALLSVFYGIVLAKEMFFDPKYEANNPFVWQGLIDLGFYIVGGLIAVAFVLA